MNLLLLAMGGFVLYTVLKTGRTLQGLDYRAVGIKDVVVTLTDIKFTLIVEMFNSSQQGFSFSALRGLVKLKTDGTTIGRFERAGSTTIPPGGARIEVPINLYTTNLNALLGALSTGSLPLVLEGNLTANGEIPFRLEYGFSLMQPKTGLQPSTAEGRDVSRTPETDAPLMVAEPEVIRQPAYTPPPPVTSPTVWELRNDPVGGYAYEPCLPM